jgi:GT2 family glycosyltransferase
MIELISATESDQADFSNTPLGRSINRIGFDNRLVPHIAFSNEAGLPTVYNARIRAKSDADLLLFIHDDVWIDDCFVADRIIDGLSRFDVIGVAGNRRLPKQHVSWYFINENGQKDEDQYLSGAVAHGAGPFGPISWYGPSPADCELLDGVLLAAKRSTLRKASVEFDGRFDFHFYDLDFSRSAHQAGLRLGTWPIAITHASGGSFGTPPWQQSLEVYREKWG